MAQCLNILFRTHHHIAILGALIRVGLGTGGHDGQKITGGVKLGNHVVHQDAFTQGVQVATQLVTPVLDLRYLMETGHASMISIVMDVHKSMMAQGSTKFCGLSYRPFDSQSHRQYEPKKYKQKCSLSAI